MSRIFITGGTGCIGAATVHNLLTQFGSQIERILIATRNSSTDQLEIWFRETLSQFISSGQIAFVSSDVGDSESIAKTLNEFQPTHVIHLSALQSPACDADPMRGLEVNLTGTLKLFQQVKTLKQPLERFVFASSGAVYGKRTMYPTDTIAESAQFAPPNLYGVWKVGGEHLAALFHGQTGVPTVSLRLNTTYGPGRDQGTTSAVTRIMKSLMLGAAANETMPCPMPYQGRENYHYVEDVGAHFAGVTMMPFSGCQPLNIKGRTIDVQEFLDTISLVAGELGVGQFLQTGIAVGAAPNLFVCDLNDTAIETAFPGLPRTPIAEGVRKTLLRFKEMVAAGKLKL